MALNFCQGGMGVMCLTTARAPSAGHYSALLQKLAINIMNPLPVVDVLQHAAHPTLYPKRILSTQNQDMPRVIMQKV